MPRGRFRRSRHRSRRPRGPMRRDFELAFPRRALERGRLPPLSRRRLARRRNDRPEREGTRGAKLRQAAALQIAPCLCGEPPSCSSVLRAVSLAQVDAERNIDVDARRPRCLLRAASRRRGSRCCKGRGGTRTVGRTAGGPPHRGPRARTPPITPAIRPARAIQRRSRPRTHARTARVSRRGLARLPLPRRPLRWLSSAK